jgi:UPF0755 protein
MLDELELAFDEQDRRRHRHRRSSRRKQARARRDSRPGRSLAALLLTLVILGGLGGAGWYGFQKAKDFFAAPDYTTGGTGEVMVEVLSGETSTDIAQTLFTKGVVKSPKAFVNAARDNPRSTGIQPGTYKLRSQMRASDALNALLDRANRVINKLVIPEGTPAKAILDMIAKATAIPLADLQNAAKDPIALGVPESWFARGDGKPAIKSIEGFLFPATYELNPGLTAEKILQKMVAKFLSVAQSLNLEQAAQSIGRTPFEALVVASLAQAEAGVAEDMPPIAKVVYNRLAHKPPINLQFDATTNYWLSQQGQQRKPSQKLTPTELNNPQNPYNTATKPGLPPGPIGNPGERALQAAVNPPNVTYLFFVLIDKSGKSAFATTDAEHERNKEIARKNGVL